MKTQCFMWDKWRVEEFLVVALFWNLVILIFLLTRSIKRTLEEIQEQAKR